jgi:hypothetical protein
MLTIVVDEMVWDFGNPYLGFPSDFPRMSSKFGKTRECSDENTTYIAVN